MRMMYTINEASEELGGMSRSTLYEEIKAGHIATVKVGRRSYIAHTELERYVTERQALRTPAPLDAVSS